jgi:hypothetical protein
MDSYVRSTGVTTDDAELSLVTPEDVAGAGDADSHTPTFPFAFPDVDGGASTVKLHTAAITACTAAFMSRTPATAAIA